MRVSVVIATYQRAEVIERAVDSALAQRHAPDEILVVDDGSTDDTADRVAAYGDPVRLLRQENRERGAARNHGVSQASGAVVAFLDSDDEWAPTHLESILRGFARDDVVLAFGRARFVEEPSGREFFRSRASSVAPTLRSILLENPVAFSASAVRRHAFSAAGGFSEDRDLSSGGAEDWDLWIRLAAIGRVRSVAATTATVYFHPGNTVSDVDRHVRGLLRLRERLLDDRTIAAHGLRRVALAGSVRQVAMALRRADRPREGLGSVLEAVRGNPGLMTVPGPLARTIAGCLRDMVV